MSARRAAAVLYGLALAALPRGAAQAQYFGRNKVLWEQLEFEVLETEHLAIHYYPPRAAVADDVARLSERWYERFSDLFEHELEEPNPLIVYQDHADFQQTLTTSGLIGEGVGGFTESLQNRVVLPLTGINAENDHVLGHELVHAFQFALLLGPPGETPKSEPQRLPLWLTEGLAEYLTQGRRDAQTAMWLRDAVLNDLLPDPRKLRRLEVSPYHYGQALWAYIGGRWGDRAAMDLFVRAAKAGDAVAIREVLELEPEELFTAFHASLREASAPVLAARDSPRAVAERLVATERGARLNVAPALSPDGTRLAFLSSRDVFTIDLYLADLTSGEVVEKLLSADGDPHFDYLSYVDSSVAWSPDGRRLAFTVFAEGERRIVVFDVAERRIDTRIALPGVKGIRNPAWSPDGQRLAFSATVDGGSDLYTVELATQELRRLTADPYTAIQPAFAPDGRTLVFVTDRGPGTNRAALRFGDLTLALLDLSTREITPLTILPRGKHLNPQFSEDGTSIYFIGEPDGVPDVFRYDSRERATTRLTALKTGVSGLTGTSPALSVAASGAIVFSALDAGRLDLYRLTAERPLAEPLAAVAADELPPGAPAVADVVQRYLDAAVPAEPTAGSALRTPYRPRLDLAYVGPATVGVSVDSYGTGVGGSLSAYFTDPLGTRQLASTVFGGTWGGELDFKDAFGGETVYLNQRRRLQWGVVGSRLPYLSGATFLETGTVEIDGTPVPADAITNIIDVVTASEVGAFAQFPFSLTRRIETSASLSHIGYERSLERLVVPAGYAGYVERFDLPAPPSLDLERIGVAYVSDSSYYGFLSPLRGRRFRLEHELTTGDLKFGTTLFDYRRYFFTQPMTVAFRALHVGRRGADAESPRLAWLDVGRDSLVRGYDLGSFDLAECTLIEGAAGCPEFERLLGSRIAVLNLELRFPLLGNRDLGLFRAPRFPLEAVVFVDVGAAWRSGQAVDWRFARDTTDRVPVVSAGIAARVLLGGVLPLEVFYAKPYQRPREDATFGFMITTGW